MSTDNTHPSSMISEDYELEAAPFTRGNRADVYKCTSRRTGGVCVAKIYRKDAIDERRLHNCIIEAHMGQSIPAHPNVLRGLGLYNEEQRLCVLSEYMSGGTLFQHLISGGPMVEEDAGRLIAQVLRGAAHLHAQGVMHRDIKPENLFFRTGTKDTVVIGDFGFATSDIPSEQYVGSPQYSAPETALIALQINLAKRVKAYYNEKCDVWSIGVVAFVMLTGLLPFDGATTDDVFRSIVRNAIPFNKPECRTMSQKARQFILALMESNPSKRPSAQEALRHPWVTQL